MAPGDYTPGGTGNATRQTTSAKHSSNVALLHSPADSLAHDASLPALAAAIAYQHEAAESHAATAVEHACKAGELLAQAKAQLEHGQWLPWLAANVTFSERTARNYMRIAGKLPELEAPDRQRVADLPLRQALAYLADEREIVTTAREIFAERTEARRADRMGRIATIAAGNPPAPDSLERYAVIYADPPWTYDNSASDWRRVENHYPTMAIGDITALLADTRMPRDAVLYLWVPNPLIPEGVAVMHAWGFTHKTAATWDKGRPGIEYYFCQQSEQLFLGTRGNVPPPAYDSRPPSIFMAARRGHSEKPDEAYQIIERMYPALPKIELFARTARPGWSAWGNQAPGVAP